VKEGLETKIASQRKSVNKLDNLVKELNTQIKYMKEQLDKTNKQLMVEKNTLANLTKENQPLFISDHAVLRYLERVQGVNVEGIRNLIKDTVTGAGGTVTVAGVQYKVNGNSVVTTIVK